MEEQYIEIILIVISAVLTLVARYFGKEWLIVKDKLAQTTNITVKFAAAIEATSSTYSTMIEAIQDDKLTRKEVKDIAKKLEKTIEEWEYVRDEAQDLLTSKEAQQEIP
ncbi:MAG: hypothetical protein ACOC5T_05210 [Elusimicrobiota bacterium]